MEQTYVWHRGACAEMIEALRQAEFSSREAVDELRSDLREMGLGGWILWTEDYADEVGDFATSDERRRASHPTWTDRQHRLRLALAAIYRLQQAAVVYGLLEHYTQPSRGPASETLYTAGMYTSIVHDYHIREWWPLDGDSPFVES